MIASARPPCGRVYCAVACAPFVPSCFEPILKKPEPALARSFQTKEHAPPSESVHVSAVPVGAADTGGGGTAAVPGGRGGAMYGGEGGSAGGDGSAGARDWRGQGYVQPQAGQGEAAGQALGVTTDIAFVTESYLNPVHPDPSIPVHVVVVAPEMSITVDRVQEEGHLLTMVGTYSTVYLTWLVQTALLANL